MHLISYRLQWILIILLPACIALGKDVPLNRQTATEKAIQCANDSCLFYYKAAPFDTSYAKAIYKKPVWTWGALSHYTFNGFSALVQFDKYGKKLSVKINYIIDRQDNRIQEDRIKELRNRR